MELCPRNQLRWTASGLGNAVECAEDNCDTVGAHYKILDEYCSLSRVWTTFVLDVASPNYVDTFAEGRGPYRDMETSDGGKTCLELGPIITKETARSRCLSKVELYCSDLRYSSIDRPERNPVHIHLSLRDGIETCSERPATLEDGYSSCVDNTNDRRYLVYDC